MGPHMQQGKGINSSSSCKADMTEYLEIAVQQYGDNVPTRPLP
jgi:hypothetical protein